nr:hypothetical protein B0A51_10685 [Rachicladosporium sp. CCFEE 5018]
MDSPVSQQETRSKDQGGRSGEPKKNSWSARERDEVFTAMAQRADKGITRDECFIEVAMAPNRTMHSVESMWNKSSAGKDRLVDVAKSGRPFALWTRDEETVLRNMRKAGMTWRDITEAIPSRNMYQLRAKEVQQRAARARALRLGVELMDPPFSSRSQNAFPECSISSIKDKVAALRARGHNIPTERDKWTEQEDAMLRRLCAERRSRHDIAKAMGKTAIAVRHYARRISTALADITAKSWRAHEDTQLLEYVAAGVGASQMTALLQTRTVRAIHGRVHRLRQSGVLQRAVERPQERNAAGQNMTAGTGDLVNASQVIACTGTVPGVAVSVAVHKRVYTTLAISTHGDLSLRQSDWPQTTLQRRWQPRGTAGALTIGRRGYASSSGVVESSSAVVTNVQPANAVEGGPDVKLHSIWGDRPRHAEFIHAGLYSGTPLSES